MAPHDGGHPKAGKRLKAAARFLAVYGRLPNEFDPYTAMGLYANISAVESAQALNTARAINIAMGDASALARAVYDMTGNDRLAQRVEIQAKMQKALNG